MKPNDLHTLVLARDLVERELQDPTISIQYRMKCSNLYNALRKFTYWVVEKRRVEGD